MASMSKALQTILTKRNEAGSLRDDPSRVSHTAPREATVKFPKRSDVQPEQQAIEKYIPKRAISDPVKLGSQTVQAVDVIGQMASTHIEDVAAEIEKGCLEVCTELRAISDGIRISTIEASSRVAVWCDRVNGLVAGIRHVQDALQPAVSREVENAEVEPDIERRMYEGG